MRVLNVKSDMALFSGRNNEEEYEDEMEEESKKKTRSKDLRDLKPENRRKRKEPVKPWGKKERLLVFLFLLLTVGLSSFLALQSRDWKLPGFPRLKIPEFTIPFFGEKTIIIEGNRVDQEKREKGTLEFGEKTKNLSGVYGLYVHRLSNGTDYGVNENEIFTAASLIKLPVIFALYKESEEGVLDLDTKYSLKRSDKVQGSGSLSGKPDGFVLTYREVARLMGKQSDNTAYRIALNLIGEEKVNKVINELGMVNTSLSENETTPKDIGIFFDRLWNGSLISDEFRDEIIENLTDTIYEDHLAAGIPKDIKVSHKYGREVHIVNDAGIVFSDDPFVIVLMSKGVVDKEADLAIPELSEAVFATETGTY